MPRPRPKTTDPRPAFPFVGAGEASYFEWAEVEVLFERSPSADERSAIEADVPLPLRDAVVFEGAHLTVSSEQGVGRWIDATYGRTPKPPARLTTRNKSKGASAAALRRFNRDIERWLIACHARVPIALAYRRRDGESGGTELSAWDAWSVAEASAIIARRAAPTASRAARLLDALATECKARAAELRATEAPGAKELAHSFLRAFGNARKHPDALAEAERVLAAMRALGDGSAWWSAGSELADLVVSIPSTNYVRNKVTRPLALEVFNHALVFETADAARAAHAAACPDAPSWRFSRTIAVALEVALRAGDAEAFARFSRQLDEGEQTRDHLERCARELDRSERPELAARLRDLARPRA